MQWTSFTMCHIKLLKAWEANGKDYLILSGCTQIIQKQLIKTWICSSLQCFVEWQIANFLEGDETQGHKQNSRARSWGSSFVFCFVLFCLVFDRLDNLMVQNPSNSLSQTNKYQIFFFGGGSVFSAKLNGKGLNKRAISQKKHQCMEFAITI